MSNRFDPNSRALQAKLDAYVAYQKLQGKNTRNQIAVEQEAEQHRQGITRAITLQANLQQQMRDFDALADDIEQNTQNLDDEDLINEAERQTQEYADIMSEKGQSMMSVREIKELHDDDLLRNETAIRSNRRKIAQLQSQVARQRAGINQWRDSAVDSSLDSFSTRNEEFVEDPLTGRRRANPINFEDDDDNMESKRAAKGGKQKQITGPENGRVTRAIEYKNNGSKKAAGGDEEAGDAGVDVSADADVDQAEDYKTKTRVIRKNKA